VLWRKNVARGAQPTCQIWLGAVDPHPRYRGLNLQKLPFYGKESTMFDSQLQTTGPIFLSKILHNVWSIFPLTKGKLKMGVQAGVLELGGVEIA